ncbi:SDR family NAD(P)-dependent oxidoreductase [Kribbella sp. CA-253562]|uniref:SDR family NAD(P)-dependent oxidoreductase n=1 Tax=Kribbella sp. CA-253562 TaxID=3239942 RepID=UPI003D900D49
MTADFTGKTALVTGSTSGIGREVANQLAARGAHVILSGRDEARGEAAVQAIRATGGKADFVRADLTDTRSVTHLAERSVELGGRVDILVNNAGLYPFAPTAEVPLSQFDEVYAVNVRAPFFLVAALAPAMAERGSGAIVNVSTMVATNGMAQMAVYGSSKAALQLLTKSWAAEFAASGVRVNAVSPGPTRTEGTAALGDNLDGLATTTPLNRVGRPEEVAAAIVWLASDAASLVHGAVLPVDGGRLAV